MDRSIYNEQQSSFHQHAANALTSYNNISHQHITINDSQRLSLQNLPQPPRTIRGNGPTSGKILHLDNNNKHHNRRTNSFILRGGSCVFEEITNNEVSPDFRR